MPIHVFPISVNTASILRRAESNPNIRVLTALAMSPRHVTSDTWEKLNGDRLGALFARFPNSTLVYADEEADNFYYPSDLVMCMRHALSLGAEYILFDTEQEIDPTFMVFR